MSGGLQPDAGRHMAAEIAEAPGVFARAIAPKVALPDLALRQHEIEGLLYQAFRKPRMSGPDGELVALSTDIVSGYYIIAGVTSSTDGDFPDNHGNSDLFLLKTDLLMEIKYFQNVMEVQDLMILKVLFPFLMVDI